MSIKFCCPHCQKVLRVKEELAGRKAKCPACKKPLTIPLPESAAGGRNDPGIVPADVEALAAAAFADEPKAPEPSKQKPIDFLCPYCEEPVQFSAALAGKQAPCPQCRRIIKVPVPAINEPVDWRKADRRLPSGARRDIEPAPKGAWGTATSTSRVSAEALLEADAVPVVRGRVTSRQWIVRGLTVAALVVIIVLGFLGFLRTKKQNLANAGLRSALQYLEPDKTPPLEPDKAAEIHRAAAAFYLRAGKLKDARRHFREARAMLLSWQTGRTARDLLLVDLARTEVGLGGSAEEVAAGTHISWNDTQKELLPILQNLRTREGQAEAMRQVGSALVHKGQGPIAGSLASSLLASDDKPEMIALVGLELQRAGAKEAATLAQAALGPYSVRPSARSGDAKINRPPRSPALIALLLALDQPAKVKDVLRAPVPTVGKSMDGEVRIGYAQGWALQGKTQDARRLAEDPAASAEQRLHALVVVASVLVERSPSDAVAELQTAFHLLNKELKNQSVSPWLVFHLVQISVRAGLGESVGAFANTISDQDLRHRAQLEVVRGGLDDHPNLDKLAETIQQDPNNSAAVELLARHNARYGSSSDVMQAIPGWKPDDLRPFGYIGVALGIQDASQ